jgi:molybdopterin molybdotransferase
MIAPAEAWARIARRIELLGTERVARSAAAGRVLAAPFAATVDVPAHDVSAMDGYALAAPAARGAELPVAGVVTAGDPPGLTLAPGTAVRIMTGAPLPDGADAVVPVESTDRGRERVTLTASVASGEHVRRRGEIHAAGRELLRAGHLVTPGALALLASHGAGELPVRALPRVAVLATGNEVVPPEVEPGAGQLRDSNTSFLLAAVGAAGCPVRSLGIAPDDPRELSLRVGEGLRSDVLLVCGGVSMGELDLVEGVLAEAGCETLFDSVAIQPGKPLVAARHAGGWVFGLPGNPASVMVCYWLFVRPLLRSLGGLPDAFWAGAAIGTLSDELPGAGNRDRFLAAELEREGGALRVRPFPPKGSHDVAAYAHGTGLVRVRAGAAPTGRGDPCEALALWP